ncbi:RNA polymerase subunit sigma-70, partial [Sutterella seckii]
MRAEAAPRKSTMGKTTKKTTADNADEAVIETPAKAADPAEKAEDAKALKPAKARRTKKADAEKAADSEKEKPAKRKKKAEAEASDDAEKPAKAKKAKKEKAEKPKKAKASKKAAAAQEEDSDENEFSDDVDSIDPDDLAEADDISVDDSDEDAAEVDAWQEGKVSDDDAGTDGDGVREPGAQPKNGYGELVRLGRTRGWVTLADINDYLPESALRTSENLQEVTEQLGRLGIQVFETPPDEDDILINGMGGDTGDDIDEDDAAVMLTPEESAGLSKDPLRAYLRGVGSHKLLTRAGEIEVAKSIEQFTIRLVSTIVQYPSAVEEILRLGEVLRDENTAVDTVVDGFNDAAQKASETADSTNGDEIATDIGAAAMTVDQLSEMRERVLSLFDAARGAL